MRTALLAAFLLLTACSREPVGYYDPQRVFDEVEAATARPLFETAVKDTRVALERAEADLKKSSELVVGENRAKVDAARDAYEKAVKEANAALSKKFDDRVRAVVAKLASKRRMTLVLAITGKPVYGSPSADLTAEIIAAMDGSGGELAKARAAERLARERRELLEQADAGRKRTP
jgi:Skp family chaperone for outer membrane proteins